MFLVGHASVAAAIVAAARIKNPAAAFGVGWISHYAVDFLPHGDEALGAWTKRGNEVRRFAAVFAADLIACAVVFSYVFSRRGFSLPILAAAAGSTVPDVMWGLEKLFGRKLFGPHGAFHERNHNFLKVNLPFWFGISFQIAVAAALSVYLASI